MLHSAYKIGVAAVLLGLFFTPGLALAQSERPRKINDELHLFSNKAVDEANGIIATIKKKHRKDLWIETREKGPDKASAAKWMEDFCDKQGIDGVAVLITKEPKHFEVYVGNKTMSKGYFTASDRTRLREILSAKLGKKSDEALVDVANFTLDTMNRHAPATAPAKKGAAPIVAPQADIPGHAATTPSWLPWVCGIVAVVIVIWVVFAIIRGITGMMGGGGGYGGGGGMGYGGGGYGGGGGGGFFSSMLGGLFGAAAGMYLYNNFFGGHSAVGASGMGGAGTQGGGDAAAAGTPYEADTGGTSEGGDWGGGDADADKQQDAGGDWGGGNDAGGGGDAGGGDWGGGGDAGGGGGGDWGGGGDAGGGGDWGGGGGGGDFGGGGGGGDW